MLSMLQIVDILNRRIQYMQPCMLRSGLFDGDDLRRCLLHKSDSASNTTPPNRGAEGAEWGEVWGGVSSQPTIGHGASWVSSAEPQSETPFGAFWRPRKVLSTHWCFEFVKQCFMSYLGIRPEVSGQSALCPDLEPRLSSTGCMRESPVAAEKWKTHPSIKIFVTHSSAT